MSSQPGQGAGRRWHPLAAVITVVAAAVVAIVGPASVASASVGEHLVPVFTHFSDDGSAGPSPLSCPNGQAIQGDAEFGVKAGDTWHGTAVYDFCLVPALEPPNSITYSGRGIFTGTVDGCGTGSFSYEVTNGFAQLLPNPTSPNGSEVWSTVPGSGTGGLQNVAEGLGVGIYTIQLTLANEGFFAGYVVC
jgi:hypothetical protein